MSRAESKARTRSAVLASAAAVFAEQGYNAASVEQIAERAGFTRGAFYAHFTDKADTLLALVEEESAAQFQDLRQRMKEAGPEAAVAVIPLWYEGLFGPRPLQRAVDEYLPTGLQDPDVRARLVALDRRLRALCVEAVRAGAGDNTLPIPLEEFALLAFALGSGLARIRMLEPEIVPPTLFPDALVYLWMGIEATGGNASSAIRPST